MNKNNNLIYNIYLYIFSAIGLILLIVGTIKIIDLGLKIIIFKNAEKDYYPQYPIIENKNYLEEKEQIKDQIERDKIIQETNIKAQRERTLANSLAMIFVGLPLFLYHWKIIRRNTNL